jgi:hypothetical protein
MKRRLGVVAAIAVVATSVTGIALAASSPAVTTGKATSVKQTTAVLNGTVNPNGSHTTYYFQWGLTNTYGVNGATHSAGSGTKTMSVHVTATDLIPGTVYHFRLVATSQFGTSAGADHTFKTAGHPPAVVNTGPASQVSQHSANLTGVINPNGANTTWFFQWGTTPSYGNNTTGGTVSGKSPATVVSQALAGLQAGTIFHYRLVGQNGPSGPTMGLDGIFMTFPLHRPVPKVTRHTRPLHARGGKPWVFTTTGSVSHPASFPAQFACTGFVGLRYFTGGKRVKFVLVPLQPNCTYSAQAVFHRRHGPRNRRVTFHVLVRYRGNGYLAPANARPQTITIG